MEDTYYVRRLKGDGTTAKKGEFLVQKHSEALEESFRKGKITHPGIFVVTNGKYTNHTDILSTTRVFTVTRVGAPKTHQVEPTPNDTNEGTFWAYAQHHYGPGYGTVGAQGTTHAKAIDNLIKSGRWTKFRGPVFVISARALAGGDQARIYGDPIQGTIYTVVDATGKPNFDYKLGVDHTQEITDQKAEATAV